MGDKRDPGRPIGKLVSFGLIDEDGNVHEFNDKPQRDEYPWEDGLSTEITFEAEGSDTDWWSLYWFAHAFNRPPRRAKWQRIRAEGSYAFTFTS